MCACRFQKLDDILQDELMAATMALSVLARLCVKPYIYISGMDTTCLYNQLLAGYTGMDTTCLYNQLLAGYL